MATTVHICAVALVLGLLPGTRASAQQPDPGATQEPVLRRSPAMLLLDYQVLPVKGDKPIDLMGLQVLNAVSEGLYVGAGLYAPLIRGVYGGFTAFDIGVHARQRLTSQFFATAGLQAGGGAGGRSVENAKALSGSGGFYKAYVGLGRDFGNFSIGVQASKMKFNRAAIDSTRANVFLEVPYTQLTGPYASLGQRLTPADASLAAATSPEQMLTVVFDNFRQRQPEGTFKGSFNIADLQFAQFYARDSYWYAGLGVGYRGMPLYNQVLGGIGQRFALTPRVALYGQVGIGSGGYAPEKINTDAGLLVYPRVAAEVALTKALGLSVSAGYLVAPKGSSKNASIGVALTRHLRAGDGTATSPDAGGPTYQAFRVSLFQQTDMGVRFGDVDRGRLPMVGIQVDAMLSDRWYIPLQAAVAYDTYLGYPGYGELLGGIGLQSPSAGGQRLQGYVEAMAGTNVHGLAVKASAGLRLALGDRLSLHVAAGRIEARSAAGNRFIADSLALGLDYRFSIPTW